MNLADARLGQAEDFGNFAQMQVLGIIERQDLTLDLRQFFQPLEDDFFEFPLRNLVHRVFLRSVRDHFI